MCQSPSVSRVFSSRYSSVSTRLYPKISELFLLSNFPTAPESCPNSLKIRWKNGSVGNGSVKTAQLTAGCSVRTPANTVSSPSMAQSSTHMGLRAIELDRSVLDPTSLYGHLASHYGGPWCPPIPCLCNKTYLQVLEPPIYGKMVDLPVLSVLTMGGPHTKPPPYDF